MDNMKGYINAIDLSKYINKKYREKYNTNISAIKLQKSLYFLFAYWGGYVKKMKEMVVAGQGAVEAESIDYKEYLFDNRIEAWIYGPVVKDVYEKYKIIIKDDGDEANKIVSELPADVKIFIDDLLDDIFTISDFKLVDISHEDRSWKNSFIESDEKHEREIKKEDIINEYSRKK